MSQLKITKTDENGNQTSHFIPNNAENKAFWEAHNAKGEKLSDAKKKVHQVGIEVVATPKESKPAENAGTQAEESKDDAKSTAATPGAGKTVTAIPPKSTAATK